MWINDIFIVITKDQRGVGRGADAFYVRNYIFGVFCKYKLPKNAEALPKSCSGKFLKVA